MYLSLTFLVDQMLNTIDFSTNRLTLRNQPLYHEHNLLKNKQLGGGIKVVAVQITTKLNMPE
jgi:hypothetical protein